MLQAFTSALSRYVQHVQRVAKAWLDITAGYSQNVDSILGQALFDEPTVSGGGGGMVLVRVHASQYQTLELGLICGTSSCLKTGQILGGCTILVRICAAFWAAQLMTSRYADSPLVESVSLVSQCHL